MSNINPTTNLPETADERVIRMRAEDELEFGSISPVNATDDYQDDHRDDDVELHPPLEDPQPIPPEENELPSTSTSPNSEHDVAPPESLTASITLP